MKTFVKYIIVLLVVCFLGCGLQLEKEWALLDLDKEYEFVSIPDAIALIEKHRSCTRHYFDANGNLAAETRECGSDWLKTIMKFDSISEAKQYSDALAERILQHRASKKRQSEKNEIKSKLWKVGE